MGKSRKEKPLIFYSTFSFSFPLRITGSVLLIIFKSLISLCFITCLIRISLNLKNDQKNRPHDPDASALSAAIQ